MKKTRLSDIFNADSIRNKKRILDRFEINKKEKRLFLDAVEGIENNGGGSDGGGSSWKYYDISNLQANIAEVSMLFHLVKGLSINGNIIIMPFANYQMLSSCIACALDLSAPIKDNLLESIVTVDEYLNQMGAAELFPQIGIIEITKEEFYNINV